jgi:hypothetical protein
MSYLQKQMAMNQSGFAYNKISLFKGGQTPSWITYQRTKGLIEKVPL